MSASNLCSIQGHTRIQYPPTDVAEITGAGVPGWVQPLGFVAFGAVFVAATHLILSDFESKPKLVRGGDTADGKARRRAGEDVCDAQGGREGGHLVVGGPCGTVILNMGVNLVTTKVRHYAFGGVEF